MGRGGREEWFQAFCSAEWGLRILFRKAQFVYKYLLEDVLRYPPE